MLKSIIVLAMNIFSASNTATDSTFAQLAQQQAMVTISVTRLQIRSSLTPSQRWVWNFRQFMKDYYYIKGRDQILCTKELENLIKDCCLLPKNGPIILMNVQTLALLHHVPDCHSERCTSDGTIQNSSQSSKGDRMLVSYLLN